MCGARMLILAFVLTSGIESSNIPNNHQTTVWSPLPVYSSSGVIVPNDNFYLSKLKDSSKKYIRKINPTKDTRDRRKKNYHWSDPTEHKRLKHFKKSKYLRKPKKYYPIENWKRGVEDTKNSKNFDVPSIYLKPPNKTNKDYQYYEKNKKLSVNRVKESVDNDNVGNLKNHRTEDSVKDTSRDNYRPIYMRDHAPEEQEIEATDNNETNDSEERNIDESKKELSKPLRDRIEYHIHGHAGPETYMFGFDTGDGDNRQYRMEERHEDGTVTGHYGYIDARGKLRKVRYKASPTHGYEEKHHEINEEET